MGYSYQFRCKDCKHEQKLYEGWSFMTHVLSVESHLQSKQVKMHYRTLEKINQLHKRYTDLQLNIEFRIYRCKQCLQVSNKLFIQAIKDNTILHQTHFKCAQCKLRLKHTNIHSLKYASCPKCQGKRFTKNKEWLLWD